MTSISPMFLALLVLVSLPLTATHADPAWDISFVSGNLDVVIIELKITGSQWSQSACYASNPACVWEEMRWVITPCPLKFAGSTSYVQGFCSGGIFDFFPPMAGNVPVLVELSAGLTYTFSGRLRTRGVARSHDGTCDNPYCDFVDEPAPAIYFAGPVATQPSTWGRVKALYRRP